MGAEFTLYSLTKRANRFRDLYEGYSPKSCLVQTHRNHLDNHLGLRGVGYCQPEKIDWKQDIQRIEALEKKLSSVSGVKNARDIVFSLTRIAENQLGYTDDEGSFEIGDHCRNYTAYLLEQTIEKIGDTLKND